MVVEHRGRHKNPGTLELLPALGGIHLHLTPNRRHGRGRGDEALLHPAVPHAAGIGGRPDVHPGAGAAGAVAAEKIAVFLPGKVGQLVKGNEVIPLALIVDLVLGMLHRAEVDFRPAGKQPAVAGGVIPGLGEGRLVNGTAPVNEFGKLGIGFPENQAPVMGNVYLPKGLCQ